MPLEGHWQRTHTPIRALSPRDTRVLLIAAAIAAVLGLIVVFAAIAGSRPAASAGCKRVIVPMATGGAAIERCSAGR
jgi:hypothetical protein